jgi:selenoprotein W-related protein
VLVCGFSALSAEKPHTDDGSTMLPQAESASNAGNRASPVTEVIISYNACQQSKSRMVPVARKERAMIHQPRVQIHYCTQCRWLLRAAWYAQELLTTFEIELGELALVPGTGGIFAVYVGETQIWSRAEQGRFPDIKELKQLVRDQVAPERSLGHTDRAQQPKQS